MAPPAALALGAVRWEVLAMKKNRSRPSRHEVKMAQALLQTVAIHGVPVNLLAQILGVGRQSIYRRLEQARTELRRAAAAAQRAKESKYTEDYDNQLYDDEFDD